MHKESYGWQLAAFNQTIERLDRRFAEYQHATSELMKAKYIEEGYRLAQEKMKNND